METYTFLRELADSWVLLALTGFYLAAILWAFRPSAKDVHREMSHLPLRNDTNPKSCDKTCKNCAAQQLNLEIKNG